jgi:hypothetical protein
MTLITEEELAARLVAELEEARRDNVFALLNTVIEPTGAPAELALYARALRRLIDDGKLTLGLEVFATDRDREFDIKEAHSFLDDFPRWFRFETSARDGPLWLFTGLRTDQSPFVSLTQKGYDAAVALLEERGYQWWRQQP